MKIVAFTGAGISQPSGVPTFEELGDEFRNNLSRNYFLKCPDKFYDILKQMRSLILNAEPNAAHLALAQYNVPIITMNIDRLHQKAGSNTVIELHGTLDTVHCDECDNVYKFEEVEKFYCCGHPLLPDVILYGDNIPRYKEAFNLVDNCDILLIVGTSFYTSTSLEIKRKAEKRWPRGSCRVVTVNENAQEEVPRLLNKWLGKEDYGEQNEKL
jgi:NAD-dependent deacetylase